MAELILALDVEDGGTALRLLDRLPPVRWVKVGSILMTREGPRFVERLVERGLQVFLDLKWHDIPSTVQGAVLAARRLGVRMVTVHAQGGRAMLAAAAAGGGGELAVVGVTILTSQSPASLAATRGRAEADLSAEVVRLARSAMDAGLDGVVSSAQEVAALRRALGERPLLVVPGIRRPGDPPDDQSRTATPAQAAQAGATHLVIGRPVLRAADPGAAWETLSREAA